MDYYLPNFNKDKSKAYTPIGVRNLLDKAVKDDGGDIQVILSNKHKYKGLWELYHTSFLALAIKKWIGKEYSLYPADSPDVYFLDQKSGEAFPVEVTELYQHNSAFDGDYKKLTKLVFEAKGLINLPTSHLLIVNRIKSREFNISQFCSELQKFNWHFERIWLSVYTEKGKQWTFFEIYPIAKFNDKKFISFNLESDRALYY